MLVRRAALSAFATLLLAAAAAACPFCGAQGQTLAGEVSQADFIVLGVMKNPKQDPADFTRGTTELHIQARIKDHEFLNGRTVLIVPRVIKPGPGEKEVRYLLFCAVNPDDAEPKNLAKARFDAYRGEQVATDSKLPEYLTKAIEARKKPAAGRLRFFFDYLTDSDLVISTDALMEFGNTEYADVRALAEDTKHPLPADKIAGWLRDKNTPASKYGLLGLLLGHSGTAKHAELLRAMADDDDNQFNSGLDGIFAGYIMLDKENGWKRLMAFSAAQPGQFNAQFTVLKVLRFFHDYRSDVIPTAKVIDGMKALASLPDIADMPIEDLRKWKRWDLTDFVLNFDTVPTHNKFGIVRRAILRFAIQAADAGNAKAKSFVVAATEKDAEKVKFLRELLDDETPKPKQ
jgi:hypothetical protein